MVPWIDSWLSAHLPGITYSFRCEAVTNCQIGTIEFKKLIEIALGVSAANFILMMGSYLGGWGLVHLRCANFMGCTLQERLALTLLEAQLSSLGSRDRAAACKMRQQCSNEILPSH
jgi:hypothetical protein